MKFYRTIIARMRRDVTNVAAFTRRRTYAVINPRIYFLRGTPNARERNLFMREARFQRARCSKVEAIAVLAGLSEKDSDLRARKTIAVLQRNARRDYHRRLLFRLSFFFRASLVGANLQFSFFRNHASRYEQQSLFDSRAFYFI